MIISARALATPFAQTSRQPDTEAAKLNARRETDTLSAPQAPNDYRDILDKERELLDAQSERYYARVDKLIELAIWFFGVVGGVVIALVVWTLGSARKDVRARIQSQLEDSGVAAIRRKYFELHREIDNINAFKQSRVLWLDLEGNPEPAREIRLLRSAGVGHISRHIPSPDRPLDLESADLVILSYANIAPAKALLDEAVRAVKQSQVPVPLIVYTPRGVRLDPPEMQKLDQLDWQITANYPVTLLGHAQTLARLSK